MMHKKARKQFAEDKQTKDLDDWNHVLWSDETKINLFGSDGVKRVWRQPGEEYKDKCVLPTVKHGGGSVMVWGCMSAAMNPNMYCDILKQSMIPPFGGLGRRAVFQHDNDPKHTSKTTTALLKKLRVKVMDWPNMSPDLNPIERLWGILKRKVEECKVSNIHQLRDVVMEEWKRTPVATCEALASGLDINGCVELFWGDSKFTLLYKLYTHYFTLQQSVISSVLSHEKIINNNIFTKMWGVYSLLWDTVYIHTHTHTHTHKYIYIYILYIYVCVCVYIQSYMSTTNIYISYTIIYLYI